MEELPDELLLYVVSFLLTPSRSAGSPVQRPGKPKWRSARREPHCSEEAVAAVARVGATCRRLYCITESVWRDLHRWRFTCSPFRELQDQPPIFPDPSLQGRWREHYIRDIRWTRIDEVEPYRALLPVSMKRKPFGCNLMVDSSGGIKSRTRIIYASGDRGKVHSLVLRRGERRLEQATTYDLGAAHSRYGNLYRMPALKQTRDWLVVAGNSGVCAFRKGDPSAKLTVREAEGEIEFAVNQPKAWLAVSCGAVPDKVSVYDMERARLVSTIAIPPEHCASGMVSHHDCLVIGGATSLLVVDLRTGDVVKELIPTALFNSERVQRWHMDQDDVSDTFLCSAMPLDSTHVFRWSDLEECRSLQLNWASSDVSYNHHAVWCPTVFGMHIASPQPPHRELSLRSGEASFAYADGRKAIMTGNIYSMGQKCVVVHDFATCERKVFHPPGDCDPLRHLYTAVADDLLVTAFDHNLALWDLALAFP